MKLLHTADWHIGDFSGPVKNGVNLRARDTENCILSMYEHARENPPDFMAISGDVFDAAQVWAARGLEETRRACGYIERFACICPIVVLRGTPNHDGDKQFEMLVSYFAENDRVQIITEPRVTLLHSPAGDLQVAALPGFDRGVYRAKFPGLSREEENEVFTDELGRIILGLKAQCDSAIPTVLISHYTVPGCNTESGQLQGLPGAEPYILPETLNAAGFDLVALGHIHRPQRLEACGNAFYSGAVNALNFNDEGQERGFWVHEIGGQSEFVRTPSRAFFTVRMEDEDVRQFNIGETERVALLRWRGMVDGKIVRVIYTCSEENNKAFSHAVMEKQLYDEGAFWVAGVLPDKIFPAANRTGLSEKTDPESNLLQYLDGKDYPTEKVAAIMETARPVIDRAAAGNVTYRLTGAFVPLSIEVKNYRNYAEEKFDFGNISFCTINGNNGAGKSSLFMDAILDCLYEEPREGDLSGWIRSAEDARSGAIIFTFRIGDATFRVTRTRTKSGKATLNVAELSDGEWENRSCEGMRDTQDEIVKLLGMDSLTLKSCALIMQDQYGIFLEANKENRMAILGNILGLGIYGDMEQLARDNATDINRQIGQRNLLIKSRLEQMKPEEELDARLQSIRAESERLTAAIALSAERRDNVKLRLSVKETADQRLEAVRQELSTLAAKRMLTEDAARQQSDTAAQADLFLARAQEIAAGVAGYNHLLEQEKQLISGAALYEAKTAQQSAVAADIAAAAKAMSDLESERDTLTLRLDSLAVQLSEEPALKAEAARCAEEKKRLSVMEQRAELYITLSTAIAEECEKQAIAQSAYNAEQATKTEKLRTLQEKMALLDHSGCIDPDNASCRFLADATAAKAEYEPYRTACFAWNDTELDKLAGLAAGIELLEKQRESLGYDAVFLKVQRNMVEALELKTKMYEGLTAVKQQAELLRERLCAVELSIADGLQRAAELHIKAREVAQAVDRYRVSADRHKVVQTQIVIEKAWLELESRLPTERERKSAALLRLAELQTDTQNLTREVEAKSAECLTLESDADGADGLPLELDALNVRISVDQGQLDRWKSDAGGILQQLEQLRRLKAENEQAQREINDLSETAAYFEILRQAFSQDGIPHNIIRSIIPMLTATANTILGQMTGGRMGMEFHTEKLLKSNKKEVVTLDIFIEEYGKGSLPYLSKSGGEKVKSALSAILALAEIKSTRAGIQLGMLFIDEPPFLDGDGMQAYCDALETIRSRYHGLKVMAITHDPAMKARFPQSLDVVKTAEGSKVIFD